MNEQGRRRFSMYHTMGTFGAAFLVVVCIVMGGSGGFIDPASMMITFGIGFFMMLASFKGDFLRFIPDSFLTLFTTPPAPSARYAEMARYGARYTLAAGLIGTLIGVIQMLRNMTDSQALGSGAAVALITVLYAVLASELFFAFIYKVYSADEPRSEPMPVHALGYVIMALAGVFVLLLVLGMVTGMIVLPG